MSRLERLIDALVAHPESFPASSRELAKQVGAVGPTTERLRSTALLVGLAVAPLPDRLYPGPLLLKWAAILGPHLDISQIVRPEIEALAAEVGETIGHVNYNPATGTAVMETVAWGNNPLKYGLATGVQIPLYAGAAGKAILAFASPEVVDQQVLVPLNPNTITNLDELLAQLVQIRENGWATGDGERIPRRLRCCRAHLHRRRCRRRVQRWLSPDQSPSPYRATEPTRPTRTGSAPHSPSPPTESANYSASAQLSPWGDERWARVGPNIARGNSGDWPW